MAGRVAAAGGREGLLGRAAAATSSRIHPGITVPLTRPSEHLHRLADDLGLVAGLTALLVLPVPRLETPLDVDLLALLEIALHDVLQLSPADDRMPFALLFVLTVLAGPVPR